MAFYLLASVIVSLLAGSSAPTPLYAVYASKWGFSPITTTVIFGVYAFAVLAALLTIGSLSDHVGRRPVLADIAIQALVMVVFISAASVPQLLIARVIQGAATGAASGPRRARARTAAGTSPAGVRQPGAARRHVP